MRSLSLDFLYSRLGSELKIKFNSILSTTRTTFPLKKKPHKLLPVICRWWLGFRIRTEQIVGDIPAGLGKLFGHAVLHVSRSCGGKREFVPVLNLLVSCDPYRIGANEWIRYNGKVINAKFATLESLKSYPAQKQQRIIFYHFARFLLHEDSI